MHTSSKLLLPLLLVGSSLAGQTGKGTQVLDGGRLLDGNGGPALADARVVVRDERIVCVGTAASCPVPADAERIELGEDTWVLPGLVDAHVHFAQTGFFDGRPDTLDLRDKYPYEETQARQQSDPERYYRAYLCSGVTAVYDVGGYPWSWDLRAAAEHDLWAPHVAAAGPLITHAPRELLNLPGQQQMLMLSGDEAGRGAVRFMAAFERTASRSGS